MGWFVRVRWSVFFCLFFLGFPAWSATVILSDVDNTLFEGREVFNGTFNTTHQVFRIETVHSPLVKPDGPEIVELSLWDFDRHFSSFGVEGESYGSHLSPVTLKDGRRFIPGHYHVRRPSTFRYFMSQTYPEVKGQLLKDFKAAYSAEGNWKGPYWPYAQMLLSHPDTAKTLGLITARNPFAEEWKSVFRFLKNQGQVTHLPNVDQFYYPVSDSKYDGFGGAHEMSKRKIMLLEQIIKAFEKAHLQDGETTHRLIFTDDSQETIQKAHDLFKSRAMAGGTPIKMVLFNSGSKSQVNKSGLPRAMVFESTGRARQATDFELLGEPKHLEPGIEIKKDTTCAERVTKGGRS